MQDCCVSINSHHSKHQFSCMFLVYIVCHLSGLLCHRHSSSGWQMSRMAAARTIAVLLVLGCLQARSDLKLSVAHNVSATATKLGFTYDTKINSKKTQLKVNYLTKGRAVTGELISSLAANKKATLAFTDKQVRNVHQGTALHHSPSHSCGPRVVSCTAVMTTSRHFACTCHAVLHVLFACGMSTGFNAM